MNITAANSPTDSEEIPYQESEVKILHLNYRLSNQSFNHNQDQYKVPFAEVNLVFKVEKEEDRDAFFISTEEKALNLTYIEKFNTFQYKQFVSWISPVQSILEEIKRLNMYKGEDNPTRTTKPYYLLTLIEALDLFWD